MDGTLGPFSKSGFNNRPRQIVTRRLNVNIGHEAAAVFAPSPLVPTRLSNAMTTVSVYTLLLVTQPPSLLFNPYSTLLEYEKRQHTLATDEDRCNTLVMYYTYYKCKEMRSISLKRVIRP